MHHLVFLMIWIFIVFKYNTNYIGQKTYMYKLHIRIYIKDEPMNIYPKEFCELSLSFTGDKLYRNV